MKIENLASDPRAALLIVDQQYDFEPGGALAVAEGDQIVPVLASAMDKFKNTVLTQDFHPCGHISFASSYRNKKPFDLITLKEVEEGRLETAFSKATLLNYLSRTEQQQQILWPDHCVQNTPGAEIDRRLPQSKAKFILQKGKRLECDSYSAFFENDGSSTGLGTYLRDSGIQRLLIAGLAGDYCVAWSIKDALREKFDVYFDLSLTRFIDSPKGSREATIRQFSELGVKPVSR